MTELLNNSQDGSINLIKGFEPKTKLNDVIKLNLKFQSPKPKMIKSASNDLKLV